MASGQCFTEQSLSEIRKKLSEIRGLLKPMEISTEAGLKGELLNLFRVCCSVPADADDDKLWETYKGILVMLKNIEAFTGGAVVPSTLQGFDRGQKINELLEYLGKQGVDVSALECDLNQDGIPFGLKVNKDFTAGSKVLEIKREWLLDSDYFLSLDELKRLVKGDPLLSSMPNVLLAFGLLFEAYDPESRWQPYIQSLPSKYTNICYFTEENFESLRGCCAFTEALNLWRSLVRQYSYLHLKLLDEVNLSDAEKSPKYNMLESKFNFNDYLWAAATVMTRMNPIPVASTTRVSLALIPAVDMCNHAEIPYSVDYDASEGKCIVYTPIDMTTGMPLKIFYGARPNLLMLLHNGFVPENNSFDFISLNPQKYTEKDLFDQRQDCLLRLGLKSKTIYTIGALSHLWDGDLRSYYRVVYACENSAKGFSLIDDDALRSKIESEAGVSEQSELCSLKALQQHLLSLHETLPKTTLEECSKGSCITMGCNMLIYTQEKIIQSALTWLHEIISSKEISN